MRIVQLHQLKDIQRAMKELKVDPYGIEIMAPKAMPYLVRVDKISCMCANILKQEMLSLGGDVAVSRDTLTARTKKTGCLLIGNLSQFSRLNDKLKRQPFGLKDFSLSLSDVLSNYQRGTFLLALGARRLSLGKRTRIMGVVNLTPDSFSGDGLYEKGEPPLFREIERIAVRQIKDGADIIDIGGESSRPGARRIPVKEEINRTAPAIKQLARRIKVPISIDTYKPEVAEAALDNGATLVNDISGLRDKRMGRVISRYKAGVVIMHMQGTPRSMQKNPHYVSLIDEIMDFFKRAIESAEAAGISGDKIILDPGIGFGKAQRHNLTLIKNLGEFKVLGKPLLIGVSRKSFIGRILNEPVPGKRIMGTAASCVLAASCGAHIVRVHDVRQVREALDVYDAVQS